jgi:hypothetical protein
MVARNEQKVSGREAVMVEIGDRLGILEDDVR